MNPPNHYKYQMEQNFLQSSFDNYNAMSGDEFSKSFRMKKYLGWDDDEVKANSEGLKKDIDLGLTEAPQEGGGF